MNDKRFFADVNLPFHVWVRERSGARGFRWVLREAPQPNQDTQGDAGGASGRDRPPSSSPGD
jgi:hypothetical protein